MRLHAIGLALIPSAAAWGQTEFIGLGSLAESGGSLAWGMSVDGSAVTGQSVNSQGGQDAFVWSVGRGMEDIGVLAPGMAGIGRDVSAAGLAAVGYCRAGTATHAFYWTREAGMVEVPGTAAGGYGIAAAISADGGTVAGSAMLGSNIRVFRWTPAGPLQVVPIAAGWSSDGAHLSADGSTVAGTQVLSDQTRRAFRWVAGSAQSEVILGAINSGVQGLSPNGQTVVGTATGLGVYRWSGFTGAQVICNLPAGWNGPNVYATSEDGTVVVGDSWRDDGAGHRAFVWTRESGMLDLSVHLRRLGVDLSGWHLSFAIGVSSDGLVIAGNGEHNGHGEAWRVRLPSLPRCYANCDGSTAAPVLNVLDFACFLTQFVAGDAMANCDGSTATPTLSVLDFMCFVNRYAAGCP